MRPRNLPKPAANATSALTAPGSPSRATTRTIFQIGVEPIRIDVITTIDGVTFDEAWPDRLFARLADQSAAVLSRRHLLINKRAAGREQDLLDVKWLERHKG
jgi:hypothetical protein